MAIKIAPLDQLLAGRDPKELFNKDGLFDELKKALAERVLNAEIDEHFDGEAAEGRKNHSNGSSSKKAPSRPRSSTSRYRATVKEPSIPS
jgi:putative transposase